MIFLENNIIIICILLAIFAYAYEGTRINVDEEIKATTATPVSGRTIVIDAGHGVPDERSTEQFWNNRG